MAHGHNFSSSVTPSEAVWNSIPTLKDFSGIPTTVFMCSYGCGLYAVPGLKDWVDLASKVMVGSDAQLPCPYAPRTQGAAGSSPASDPGHPPVRHPRVDFPSLMTPSTAHPSFLPTPVTITYDERLMASMAEPARIAASQKHTMDPVTIREAERRILRQIFDILASGIAVTFANIIAHSGAFKDREVSAATLVKNGGTEKTKIKDLQKSMFTLLICGRGLLERVDHLVEVQHKIFRSLASGSSWLKGIHEVLRPDLAAMRDVIEKPGRLFNSAQYLESISFASLGAAITSRDASATRAFFRRELPREEAQAKKLGWKPSTKPKADEGSVEDAAAPSPDRPAPATAAGAAAPSATGDGKGRTRKPNPKKKRRRAASTASTGAGTGTGTKDKP